MIKKVEVLANLAVIVASIVLCSVLVKKYFFAPKQAAAAATSTSPFSVNPKSRSALQPGTKISLPGIDWTKSNRTLVLALSTTCHFCTESAPFYQKLQQQKPSDLRLIAVLPQTTDQSRTYLDKLGVAIPEIVQSPIASIGASGTPTMILVDSEGKVQESWVGRLSEEESARVLGRIIQTTSSATD